MQPSSTLARFLPYQLSIVSNAVSSRIALEYRSRFGLTIPEWRVMAVLGDSGPLTQRDLTQRTLMDKVAVNRACKGLEDRELVSRSPNALDGRSHHLELTAAGRSMHGEIMPLALELERQLFDCFTPDEQALILTLLERMRERLIASDEASVDGSDFGVG